MLASAVGASSVPSGSFGPFGLHPAKASPAALATAAPVTKNDLLLSSCACIFMMAPSYEYRVLRGGRNAVSAPGPTMDGEAEKRYHRLRVFWDEPGSKEGKQGMNKGRRGEQGTQ